MLKRSCNSAFAIAGALLLAACTLQRAPQMSRPSLDERAAPAKAAVPAVEPPDEPTIASFPVAGSDIVGMRASVVVRAPMARVREVLFDCPSYPEFLASYRGCTDLGPSKGGGREVKMQMEELGGIIKIWMRVETLKVEAPEGEEIYDSRMVEGNIKTYRARWHLTPADRGFTRLTIESHLDPKLPLPAALINGGSVDGIKEAILALKRRSEKASGPAPR